MRSRFFLDTITIYNRLDTGKSTRYIPTVLEGCYWLRETKKDIQDKKTVITSLVSVMIMARPEYSPPHMWKEHQTGFTLQAQDIVLLGKCDKEISDDYPATSLLKDMGDNAIKINAVEVFDKPFMINKHYEIAGV